MPRLAANLSMLFTEVAPLDRVGAAAAHGFAAVEVLFPYDHPPAAWRDRLDAGGAALVLFNAPAGDWAAGERGLAGLPDRIDDFRDGVRRAAEFAAALACPRVHVMAGIGGDEHCYVANLAWAAGVLATAGAVATIEPLNPHDVPGYLLSSSAEAVRVCELAGGGVRLQADLYHLRRLGEDAAEVVRHQTSLIEHVQIAGVPDRHEPDGADDADLLALLDVVGFAGWVGCEYHPRRATAAGLGWAAPFGISVDDRGA